MINKEIFLKEKEQCNEPFHHIMKDITDPALKEIDKIYGYASCLSRQNQDKHENNLKLFAIHGTAITAIFFIYYEWSITYFIIICVSLLLVLILIYSQESKKECHQKYLEYRVLAETLRVQLYLSIAGAKVQVKDILPFFIKNGIPWIEEILDTLPLDNVKEKKPIINYWITTQKEYHEKKLSEKKDTQRTYNMWERRFVIITVASYIITSIFEILIYLYPSMSSNSQTVRMILNIIIVTMSAGTLFLKNYYGKMSLSETIEDHKRMKILYEKTEQEKPEEETEEILLNLARECLIENSTWYSYQKKNKAKIVI